MDVPKDLLNEYPGLDAWSMLAGYRGSIAHGMYVPSSDPDSVDDKDIMSVCVPPLTYFIGRDTFGSRGTQEIFKGEWDVVIYDVRKFISMLVQGNPNVLSLIWLEPNYYTKMTAAGEKLIKLRSVFAGRHVYRSFTGYAHGQLHRMTHNACQGHLGDKRRGLVEKHGYDTKNAAHLIRLLRMGTEFLMDGRLHVFRHDAAQLLEIKHGEWTLQQVLDESDHWFKLAEDAYSMSILPDRPNPEWVNRVQIRVIECALEELHGVTFRWREKSLLHG